jgi:hypothetical protein
MIVEREEGLGISIFAVCDDGGWWGNLGFFLHAEAVGGAGGGGFLE